VGRVREIHRLRRRVRVGTPDPSLTPVSGMAAVTELVSRLGMIKLLDAAIGPIKTRDRGLSGGQLLVGLATAQLAGEEFLVGLDRQRADAAGQVLAPVPGLSSTTAAGLARRLSDGQWQAVETGIGEVHAAMLAALPAARAAALCETVTIDLDTTDVEVYGSHKRGVASNYQGQRCGRPHVASWAQTATVLAADLMAGNEDPRGHAAQLLSRALAALPSAARTGRILLRADAGYFADPRARRRRTLRPDQRALPIVELAELNAVDGYSFIVTNRDVSTPNKAAAVEHWYRHRTQVENIFRDATLGAALRHLPSGYPQINRAWMWGARLAVSIAGWLHQLTATPEADGQLLGHGVRDGQAMITTLRHRLIRVPARLIRHAGALTLRLPPGYHLLETVLARLRALPATS